MSTRRHALAGLLAAFAASATAQQAQKVEKIEVTGSYIKLNRETV